MRHGSLITTRAAIHDGKPTPARAARNHGQRSRLHCDLQHAPSARTEEVVGGGRFRERHPVRYQPTERWLLSIWQAARQKTWRLWRGGATVSLEYFADSRAVGYHVHCSRPLFASLSHSLLQALVPGVELSDEDCFADPTSFGRRGVLATFRLRNPGWVELPKDAAPEAITGLLAALSGLGADERALVQCSSNRPG